MHTHTLYCAAYFNDLVVGAVCCRVETEGDKHRMYIMTLGCLAPYRRLGIGMLLCRVVGIAWGLCCDPPQLTFWCPEESKRCDLCFKSSAV